MSGLKDIAKNGWHPKGKDGAKESWRTDNKGVNTVAGWMGKGKQPGSTEAAYEHQSTPLSSLKDPASFAPPPRRVPGAAPPLQRRQQAQEEEEANRPSAGPYQADTTGLNTAHLPKPPAFRPSQTSSSSAAAAAKPKPSLPPRLPPRQNEYPDANTPAPPPPYSEAAQDDNVLQGELNQGATSRLGGLGVSVPGLGIGRASPPVPPRQNLSPSNARVLAPAPPTRRPQQSGAQPSLAGSSAPSNATPKTGTTWAEKQAAIKTAGNLRDDPSKVTLADARSAASTANNFRQRHGEQAAAGLRTASSLNQKYGISDRVNGPGSSSTIAQPPTSPTQNRVGKKPAPPPPPKKRELTTEPPPIPLSSKPKF